MNLDTIAQNIGYIVLSIPLIFVLGWIGYQIQEWEPRSRIGRAIHLIVIDIPLVTFMVVTVAIIVGGFIIGLPYAIYLTFEKGNYLSGTLWTIGIAWFIWFVLLINLKTITDWLKNTKVVKQYKWWRMTDEEREEIKRLEREELVNQRMQNLFKIHGLSDKDY